MTPSRIDSQTLTPLNLGKQGIACRIHGEGCRLSRRYIDTHARGRAFVEIDYDLAPALVEVNDPHGRIDRREAMSAGFENATTKSVEVNGAPFIFREWERRAGFPSYFFIT